MGMISWRLKCIRTIIRSYVLELSGPTFRFTTPAGRGRLAARMTQKLGGGVGAYPGKYGSTTTNCPSET